MRLNSHVNSLDIPNQLPVLNSLLHFQDRAQPKVTFWGKRVITVGGYRGTYSLEVLAKKVLKAGGIRSDADNLSIKERVAGIEITQKLNEFYRITDTQIKNANWFTRLLNTIREFTILPNMFRLAVDEFMEDNFCGFSESRYQKEMGTVKDELGRYEGTGSYGGATTTRITAPTSTIYAKLAEEKSLS